VAWSIIIIEGHPFEDLVSVMRFHVGLHTVNCKFTGVLGASEHIW
jgi:hypothetical protein